MPQLSALQNLVQLMENIGTQGGEHAHMVAEGQEDTRPLDTDAADQTQNSYAIGEQNRQSGSGISKESSEGFDESDQQQQRQETPAETTKAAPTYTKEQIFAALQSFDSDVTHQFAALDIMREHFASAGASDEFQAILDEAAVEFEKSDIGRDVRAGFAAAKVADQASQTLETNPAAVRDTYRDMLREMRNVGQLFDALTKYDLKKDFGAVVETFRQIASQDLASTGPSTDPTFLHTLLTEIGKLKKMQTTYEMCRDLIVRTDRLLPRQEKGLTNPNEVTSRLLNFSAKATVSLTDAKSLLGGMEKAGPQGQVVFANGLRGLHGELPDEIMPTPQARTQQITALSSLLNNLVAAEEDFYAASQKPTTGNATSA